MDTVLTVFPPAPIAPKSESSPASAGRPYPVLATVTVYIRLHSSDNGIATEMFWDGDHEGAMSLVGAVAYSDYGGTRAGFLLSSPPRIPWKFIACVRSPGCSWWIQTSSCAYSLVPSKSLHNFIFSPYRSSQIYHELWLLCKRLESLNIISSTYHKFDNLFPCCEFEHVSWFQRKNLFFIFYFFILILNPGHPT